VLENGIGATGVKCVVRIRQAGGVADPQRHLRAEVRGAPTCLGGHRFAGIYSRHLGAWWHAPGHRGQIRAGSASDIQCGACLS